MGCAPPPIHGGTELEPPLPCLNLFWGGNHPVPPLTALSTGPCPQHLVLGVLLPPQKISWGCPRQGFGAAGGFLGHSTRRAADACGSACRHATGLSPARRPTPIPGGFPSFFPTPRGERGLRAGCSPLSSPLSSPPLLPSSPGRASPPPARRSALTLSPALAGHAPAPRPRPFVLGPTLLPGAMHPPASIPPRCPPQEPLQASPRDRAAAARPPAPKGRLASVAVRGAKRVKPATGEAPPGRPYQGGLTVLPPGPQTKPRGVAAPAARIRAAVPRPRCCLAAPRPEERSREGAVLRGRRHGGSGIEPWRPRLCSPSRPWGWVGCWDCE